MCSSRQGAISIPGEMSSTKYISIHILGVKQNHVLLKEKSTKFYAIDIAKIFHKYSL